MLYGRENSIGLHLDKNTSMDLAVIGLVFVKMAFARKEG